MISFIRDLFTTKPELAEYNKGNSFSVAGVPFSHLTDCIAQLPTVVFTNKRKFFWGFEKYEADFTFRELDFKMETDVWDGSFWVISKTGARIAEMQELREHIQRSLISSRSNDSA